MKNLATRLACALLLGGCAFGAVRAQDYPNRPIKIIVPFSPGGAVDGPTRAIAQELSKRLKQQVLIDNRPGAGATIGSEMVAKAAPDGYTLLLASQTNAISATLYPKLSFNPIDEFVGISLLGREPGVLVVHPAFPPKTVAELLAYAKERPDQVNYASSGNGSGQHLFTAMFASMAGIKLTHVPYRRGHRIGILDHAIAPIAQDMPSAVRDRLHRALSIVYGIEPYIVLKDIWGLPDREVERIALWMADALVDAALRDAAAGAKVLRLPKALARKRKA